MLNMTYLILNNQYARLNTQYPVLNIQYSLHHYRPLNTYYSLLNPSRGSGGRSPPETVANVYGEERSRSAWTGGGGGGSGAWQCSLGYMNTYDARSMASGNNSRGIKLAGSGVENDGNLEWKILIYLL